MDRTAEIDGAMTDRPVRTVVCHYCACGSASVHPKVLCAV